MWDHASDGLVEDTGRCAEVERTASSGVVSGHLSKVCMVLDWREKIGQYGLSSGYGKDL
jgi:hypothetical protein